MFQQYSSHHCPKAARILLCNKIDLRNDPVSTKKLLLNQEQKPISSVQGELMAKQLGCLTYLETSAKTMEGIGDFLGALLKGIAIHRDVELKKEKKCQLQ